MLKIETNLIPIENQGILDIRLVFTHEAMFHTAILISDGVIKIENEGVAQHW